tara:strand:- start:168 stop:1307 length:1140 start_codon:yes stop_codon:yes gene_type:complete
MPEWKQLITSGSDATLGAILQQSDVPLIIRTITNGIGAGIILSDHVNGSFSQGGHITFKHSDTTSYGSGASIILGSNQTSTTILADGKLMFNDGIYSKPASGTGAGTRKDQNWDTAYGWGNHSSEPYVSTADATLVILTSMTTGQLMLTATSTSPPTDHIHLAYADSYDSLSSVLDIRSAAGSVTIGCENTSWAHFKTGNTRFYFNKEVTLADGKLSSYAGYDLILRRAYNDTSYNQITIGDDKLTVTLDGSERMIIDGAGTAHFDKDVVAYSTTPSDSRLKKNILPIQNALSTICKLEGVSYDWRYKDGNRQLGVIAQQVQEFVPEIVTETKLPLAGKTADDDTTYKTVNYEMLVPHLIEAIKELTSKVEYLESKIGS